MMINTNAIVSASEANQNFSRVTRIADAQGQAVIFKNKSPNTCWSISSLRLILI